MKIKTATQLGMIGAIISFIIPIFYFLINAGLFSFIDDFTPISQIINLLNFFSGLTIFLFFYTLYKNQNKKSNSEKNN